MTTIEAIILGVIQGLTEFLPVSSSGHLTLAQSLLGLSDLDKYIIFDLVCHLGTLLAIFVIFFNYIWQTLFNDRSRLFQVVLGTLPLFPLVLILKPIKDIYAEPQYLGFFFLTTACLLYAGIRLGSTASTVQLTQNRYRNSMVIGLFQALAILPGVSRSGSTISAGRLLGMPQEEAVSFSFLLAIPAILGAVALEILQLLRLENAAAHLPLVSFWAYAAGFLTSFIIGYFSLRLLMRVASKGNFIYFVWYCLFIGIFSLWYFH